MARAKRRWRGEEEKGEIPLPFSLPPYPLPFSTPATQATSTEDRASVSSCTSVHRSVDLRTYWPLLIIKKEILHDYDRRHSQFMDVCFYKENNVIDTRGVASISPGGGGGYFRNFWVGMCRWEPGTLNLYQS